MRGVRILRGQSAPKIRTGTRHQRRGHSVGRKIVQSAIAAPTSQRRSGANHFPLPYGTSTSRSDICKGRGSPMIDVQGSELILVGR